MSNLSFDNDILVVSPILHGKSINLSNTINSVSEIGQILSENAKLKGRKQRFENFINLLQSLPVSGILVRDTDLYHKLSGHTWDSATKTWVPPSAPRFELLKNLSRLTGRTQWQPPSAHRLRDHLQTKLAISRFKRSVFYVVSYEDTDPEQAKNVLSLLYFATDKFVKERVRLRIAAEIQALKRRLEEIRDGEHSEALTQLLRRLETQLLITDIDAPYAAELIQTPEASDVLNSPSPARSIAVAVLIGLFAGLTLAFVYDGWLIYKQRRQANSHELPTT